MISNLAISFSLISGIMSCLLFTAGMYLEKEKKKSRTILIWACLFLAGSFAGLEWAFWLEGYDMFELVFSFTFPLIVYFAIWFGFIIWLFESRKERKIWIALSLFLILVMLLVLSCMNCVKI